MYAIRGFLSMVARLMITAIFGLAAFGKVMNFNGVVELMAREGVPSPMLLLVGAIACLMLGSLAVFLGWKARFGALLLLAFLAAATYYFHDFWKLPAETPPAKRQEELIAFMKNLALMGTMVFILANGAGPWSVDNLGRKSGRATGPAASDEDAED